MGQCIINDDEIIVIIGTQRAQWLVPGGPWTIEYTTATETVAVITQHTNMFDGWDDISEKLFNNADESCIDSEPRSVIALPIIKKSTSIYVKRSYEEAVADDIFAALHRNPEVNAEINEALRCNPVLDHTKILDALERKIEHYMRYNQERLSNRYDYNALGISGCSFVVALGLGYVLLKETDKKDQFFEQQFKEKKSESIEQYGYYCFGRKTYFFT